MMFLLDTNAFSDLMRKHSRQMLAWPLSHLRIEL